MKCLYSADEVTIDRLLYQPSASVLMNVNNDLMPVILNSSMQLQLAYKQYIRDMPEAEKHKEWYTTLCLGDLRRCVYSVKTITLLLSRCRSVNLVFEGILFVWTLLLLSLYKSLLPFVRVIPLTSRVQKEMGSNGDVSLLLNTLTDYFILFFNTPKVNLSHFSIPDEYKSVVDLFYESCVCSQKRRLVREEKEYVLFITKNNTSFPSRQNRRKKKGIAHRGARTPDH